MSNNKWSEQKIDQLLRQVPKLKDTRSKDDVLKRLQQDPRLAEVNPKKRKVWIPPAVAVAALITLTLLVATMINAPNKTENAESLHFEQKSSDIDTGNSSNESAQDASTMLRESEEYTENESQMTILEVQEDSILTSVYTEDLVNYTAFKIGLVSQDALVVPITFLIPNEQIQQDFGNQAPNTLQLYEQYAADINEEELGFTDYHPYKGKFEIDQDQLVHRLPKEHDYDLASAAINAYDLSLQFTFEGFTQINHQNEDGSQAEFDQVGQKTPTVLTNGLYKTPVYPYTDPTGQVYMVPNLSEPVNNMSDALKDLKTSPNDFFANVVPSSVTYTIEEIKGVSHIKFSEPLELNSLPQEQATQMIESFVLTGASFGVQIQLDNVIEEQWNGINLTQPLEQPVGLNKYSWK
ncbi:hypothetical protein [Paenisporosarcina sp. TG20]|uniref:hypothetical protein n=1 Tax=Paenisporosarcina sp. TG20 TaxID=1211706 RepID=UPI0002EEAA25|nr:hypothetical protein [Paenisporosarcina sp. TG20]